MSGTHSLLQQYLNNEIDDRNLAETILNFIDNTEVRKALPILYQMAEQSIKRGNWLESRLKSPVYESAQERNVMEIARLGLSDIRDQSALNLAVNTVLDVYRGSDCKNALMHMAEEYFAEKNNIPSLQPVWANSLVDKALKGPCDKAGQKAQSYCGQLVLQRG